MRWCLGKVSTLVLKVSLASALSRESGTAHPVNVGSNWLLVA
jgi:hypothetical protein